MKKLPALFLSAIAYSTIASSCSQNDHDINISYQENGDYYSMKAHFSKRKTRAVENYMDDQIGRRSKMSFVNSRIDGTIVLDDHTKFYLKKSPGILEIKLDKDENPNESYDEIKSMCTGMKKILTE